jgi:hypothetical protein
VGDGQLCDSLAAVVLEDGNLFRAHTADCLAEC